MLVPSDSPSTLDLKGIYYKISMCIAFLAGSSGFLCAWIYSIFRFGFFLGVGLGWIPSIVIGLMIGAITFVVWPIFAVGWLFETVSGSMMAGPTTSNATLQQDSTSENDMSNLIGQGDIGKHVQFNNRGIGCTTREALMSVGVSGGENPNCRWFASSSEGIVVAAMTDAVEVYMPSTNKDFWFGTMKIGSGASSPN